MYSDEYLESKVQGIVPLFKRCHYVFSSLDSATVNNLQAKVDALEKSNTKLTEEVSVLESFV